MDNFEKLEKAVRIMEEIIPDYVRKRMEKQYGTKAKAFDEACENLGKNTPSRQNLATKGWDNGIDLYIGLRLIGRQQELFKKELTEGVWAYCQRMLFYRNLVSHKTAKEIKKLDKDEKAIRVWLEEIAVFCNPIDKKKSGEVLALLEAVPEPDIRKTSDEDTKKNTEVPVPEQLKPALKLTRGMRGSLNAYCDIHKELRISLYIKGGAKYDFSCLCLGSDNKIVNDYVIHENHKESPEQEIVYAPNGKTGHFYVHFDKLPDSVQKVQFAVCIDGESTMEEIAQHTFRVAQNDKNFIRFELAGEDFRNQLSVISVEFYRKDGQWKFWAIADGISGNFEKLLETLQ